MAFSLTPGKLGFKLGDVLVGLADGTEDTPEAIKTTAGRAHFIPYQWNPQTLSYEAATPAGTADPLALKLDNASSTVMYVGEAAAGSATSAAVWRIKKLDTSSGVALSWADGDTSFDNVWDARASLTNVLLVRNSDA